MKSLTANNLKKTIDLIKNEEPNLSAEEIKDIALNAFSFYKAFGFSGVENYIKEMYFEKWLKNL